MPSPSPSPLWIPLRRTTVSSRSSLIPTTTFTTPPLGLVAEWLTEQHVKASRIRTHRQDAAFTTGRREQVVRSVRVCTRRMYQQCAEFMKKKGKGEGEVGKQRRRRKWDDGEAEMKRETRSGEIVVPWRRLWDEANADAGDQLTRIRGRELMGRGGESGGVYDGRRRGGVVAAKNVHRNTKRNWEELGGDGGGDLATTFTASSPSTPASADAANRVIRIPRSNEDLQE
ncbi:hypothetical protein R3P38DRAFT_2791490 [Favolaschia claudopus]|uniref:Uncharacterized protein n=1 Tax=Favolaschia claudopus TaxID=2862362 RepID=A0AAW0AHI0_9AGAR